MKAKTAFLILIILLILSNSGFSEIQHDTDKLMAGLNDKDWSDRLKAALVLGKIKNPRTIKPLVQTLSDDNFYVRRAAANALIQIGKPCLKLLSISVRDVDWFVRKESVYALSEIDGVGSIGFITEALRDEDLRVTNEAKTALIKIGKPAIKPVIVLLNDRNGDVKRNAGYVLSKIGKPAVEPLIGVLKNADNDAVIEAVWALGEIGDSRAVNSLILILKNENSIVRWEAIAALGKIGDEKIVEFIRPMLNNENSRIKNIAKEVTERLKNKDKKGISVAAFKN
ncbi:MAG: HEAT repeat domain-containing protein [bacterium]